MKLCLFTTGLTLAASEAVLALTSYANEFIPPDFLLVRNWSDTTQYARDAIVQGAAQIAAEGPWTVTSKTVMPTTKNTHYWPNCTNAGNNTELTTEQIMYLTRVLISAANRPHTIHVAISLDDLRIRLFQVMSDSVFFNSMAWVITRDDTYASNATEAVKVWFVDPATAMTTNLNYAQLKRGPGSQIGQHTGVLDLKCMSKLVSGGLMLRNGSAPARTSDIDQGLKTWVTSYIRWLTTANMALQERAATNNHGSFYFNQLAALQVLVGDTAGAKKTIQEYFAGISMNQISTNGDQPLETPRTRPYHCRAYNLAAMIVNARIGQYVGFDDWLLKTDAAGATIQDTSNYDDFYRGLI